MKLVLAVLFMVGTAVSADFQCDVRCPTPYRGACVKSDTACHCSCSRETKALGDFVAESLREQKASEDVQDSAKHWLDKGMNFSPKVFKDRTTGKQFMVYVQPPQ